MSSALPFPGLNSPAAGFDQPFEMLSACHDRVRRSLGLLQRLVDHLAVHSVDRQAQDAAADVLRYFSVAAPHHHEDEERHVIPLLAASPDPGLREAAQRMLRDHGLIRQRWSELAPLLQAVAAGAEAPQALAEAAQAFVEVHRGHLELEDTVAFPQAAERTRDEALAAMGQEMAARRGASRSAPSR